MSVIAATALRRRGVRPVQEVAPPPGPVASVSVSPAAISVAIDETQQLVAVARDAAGQLVPGATFAWSSGDEDVATVSETGLVTAVAAGVATITAAVGSVGGTSVVTATESTAVTSGALTLTRLDETTEGTVLVSNGVPLLPGTIAFGEESKFRILKDGVEVPIYCSPMGRHSDNSYRVAFVQFEADPDEEADWTWDVGGTRNTTADLTFVEPEFVDPETYLPTARVFADPRKAGQPAACALPTDPQYLMASLIAGPGLCTRDEAAALTGTVPEGAKTTGEYAAVTDARYDYWQVGRHIDASNGAPGTGALVNKTISAYPDPDAFSSGPPTGWSDAHGTPPAYYDWRTAVGLPGSAHAHAASYGAALTLWQMWARTGDVQYWRRACAVLWGQVYHQSWTISNTGGSENPVYTVNRNGSNFISLDPSGHGTYFLLTGDPWGLRFLIDGGRSGGYSRGWGVRLGHPSGIAALGDWTKYDSEARPMARALYAMREAWMATRPHAEAHPLCDERRFGTSVYGASAHAFATVLDGALISVLDGTSRRSDGVWICKAGSEAAACDSNGTPDGYHAVNTFMQPMVMEALIRLYEDGPATLTRRADIPAAVELCCTTIRDLFWGANAAKYPTYNLNFANWYGGSNCSDPSIWSQGVPMNAMYVGSYAWLAQHLSDTDFAAFARTVLAEAVGEGGTTSQVDGIKGPYPSSNKQCHEHFVYTLPALGWLVRAA